MAGDRTKLTRQLRAAGLSQAAIDAAWPSWWTDEADDTPSASAELRFALARRLGLEPKPLLGERVEFIWDDSARFKHVTTEEAQEKAALTSFGVSIGRLLVRATEGREFPIGRPDQLRAAILSHNGYVDLQSLVATCWACRIPVVHLRVFPLTAKSMHAMVVSVDGRHAVLLGRDADYPAPAAFTLAHELGHLALGHLGNSAALVDLKDPAVAQDFDDEEKAADEYALSLLTGSNDPDIRTNIKNFGGRALANAVRVAGPQHRIEPGTLALCVAYRHNAWAAAQAALRYIYHKPKPVWRELNAIAAHELDWANLTSDGTDYLRAVLGLE